MKTLIRNHFNLRPLCEVDLPATVLAKLDKPPALKRAKTAEDHVVSYATGHGILTLFKASVGQATYIVTSTPDVALASAT